MASPSSPILRSEIPNAVNMSSKLRRNSLVSDHEDIMLLREKLTRIAVGRRQDAEILEEEEEETEERRRSNGTALKHFKVFSLLPLERPNTPPSSPQPRDVLRKQLKLKQQAAKSRRQRTDSGIQEDDGGLEELMSVDKVEITLMEDVEGDNVVHSPRSRGHKRTPQARLSIPSHLRTLSAFSVLNKHPEGWRKRKCVHMDATEDGQEEPRLSLKKTSSQINILATSKGKLSRSSSAGGLFQKFAGRQRHEQDQEMEDAGCTTQPQSPENALFENKHGQLSACS